MRTSHRQPDVQACLHVLGRRVGHWPEDEPRRIDLENTDLRYAEFLRTNLTGVWFHEADLRSSNLKQADLRGSMCIGADIRRAFLSEANLEGADLRGADLREAKMRGARLRNAKLQGASLYDAEDLTQHQIEGAEGDSDTKLPEGLRRPAVWT